MVLLYLPSATAATALLSLSNGLSKPRQTPMMTRAAMAVTTAIIAMSAPSRTL
jgi:hypothetical protein